MSKHKINDVLYCLFGAHEEHMKSNYGDEKEWLRRVYIEIEKLSDEDMNYDLHEYTVKPKKSKQPKAGEWWMCHLKQGAWNRICVLYRPTDDLWDLPYERMGVKWNQEEVTPMYRMIEEK